MDNMSMDGKGGGYDGKKCNCPHHRMAPIFIILIGLVFLLGYFGVLTDNVVAVSWPILLILLGGQLWFGRRCKCCNNCM